MSFEKSNSLLAYILTSVKVLFPNKLCSTKKSCDNVEPSFHLQGFPPMSMAFPCAEFIEL